MALLSCKYGLFNVPSDLPTRLRKGAKNYFYFLCAAVILVSTLACTCGFLYVSSLNYPGGYGFYYLHSIVHENDVSVHIDVTSAMTGVSRFGEVNPHWKYSKEENMTLSQLLKFDYLLTANQTVANNPNFQILGYIQGFSHIEKRFPPRVVLEPSIYILHNRK